MVSFFFYMINFYEVVVLNKQKYKEKFREECIKKRDIIDKKSGNEKSEKIKNS